MSQFNERSVKALGDKWYEHPHFEETNFRRGVERINRETDAFMLSLGFEHDREKGCYKLVKPSNKRIALFAHEGFGKAFLSSLLDIPYPMMSTHFDITHTGITVINFRGEQYSVPKVLTLSDDAHIYADGLPTKYNNTIYF
jgi:probable phosphoglycerate mutase